MSALARVLAVLKTGYLTPGEATHLHAVVHVRTLTPNMVTLHAMGPYTEGEHELVTTRRNAIAAKMAELEKENSK